MFNVLIVSSSSQEEQPQGPLVVPNDSYPAHFRNPKHSKFVRYGIIVYLTGTLALLIASDIGSGVAGITHLVPDPQDTFSQLEETVLLEASIFSSVAELWHAGSYALSIFVAVTSVSWPYVKLLVSFYAWMAPITGPRRERLLVMLDVLGKWCFVDVVVFIEIMVIFRATIPLGGPTLEVYIIPKWGFFGFVTASMLDLIATHVMVHYHRKVVYPETPADDKLGLKEVGRWKDPKKQWLLSSLVATGLALYLTGFFVRTFRVQNSRGQFLLDPIDYSLESVGATLGDAGRPTDKGAVVWLQIMWFVFGLVGPLLSAFFQAALVWMPWKQTSLRRIYTCVEVANAWNCAEVFFVSTIFAVVEVPTFGSGLIDSGCNTCYVVDSKLLAELTVLGLGCAVTFGTSCFVLRVAHKALY